ncbi:MAG: Polyribonucleotide nucleotidyltransferase [Microgenomates group bacterium GW2011_GWB1_40_9]|nr:MAG: Polyribonucleotide nucleotidyltransferase [Microgenomates group bacterium GW2011_GWB1_40_9]
MKLTQKSVEIGNSVITLEVGRFAEQASAAVVARSGDTMVLAAVTASSRETTLDYFPLSVEYVERLYAGGRIKGSRWVKREGRPTDDAVLAGRVIDRSIRPLFPKTYKHDVQVIITTLSVDGENDPDILALVAASAAIAISPIPWEGPVAAVRVGCIKENGNEKGTIIINPTAPQQELSEFDFIVSSNADRVMMLEGGFCETPEDVVVDAVNQAKKANKKIIDCINDLAREVGKKKVVVEEKPSTEELEKKLAKDYKKELDVQFKKQTEKEGGDTGMGDLAKVIAEKYEQEHTIADIMTAIDHIFKNRIREDVLLHAKRVDNRKIDEVRELSMDVGLLPRTHGSAMFKRGQTQVLTVATLGSPDMAQLIESPMGEESRRYIHHYSMPPYSVGETGRVGTPSRREIGHGALAERALISVIPDESEFPYTIRLVSEIMSSNGSTSMASTCGSTLALMDAGVPIKEPVAGISVGLMTNPKKKNEFVLLTDIVGVEDFGGDMDFKVAGTKNGITAIQLDMKVDGIGDEIVKGALDRAKVARAMILEKMHAVIAASRPALSQYAPKVQMVKIPVERIGEIIGPGGKIIRQIQTITGAVVDVKDDGSVFVTSVKQEAVDKAVAWIEGITHEVKAGEEYEGEVKRMMAFGAFVEILPGKEGLVHVSQMSTGFVQNPSDVVALGQKVKVRVIEIDDQGRVNLSMLFGDDAAKVPPREQSDRPRRPFNRGPRRY